MEAKLKKKIWKVLKMISSNNGSPLIIGTEPQKINTEFLVKQFISFCSLWKYYLLMLEQEEEYETCSEIVRIVNIQKNFLVEVAVFSGVKEPEMEDQLEYVQHTIMDARPAA